MIVLAIFYVFILGLLWHVLRMLQKYFALYSSLYASEKASPSELINQLKSNKNTKIIVEKEKQLNSLLHERLIAMEDKFPTEEKQEEVSKTFTEDLKKMLHSIVTLLKTEHSEAKP